LVLAQLDDAYTLAGNETADPKTREFASEKARAVGDVLQEDAGWADAVFRVAVADLQAGTRRTFATWHLLGQLAVRHRKLDVAEGLLRAAVRGAARDTEMDAYTRLIDVLRRQRRPAEVAAVCRDGLRGARWTPPVVFNYYLAPALADLGDAAGAHYAA